VVWVTADGALVPAAAHGYQPAVLGSWGRITSGDDNLTARAWRTADVQAVTVEEGLAALAVPLVDRDGCFGVLAAELTPQTGTNADDVRAAMTVLAAQLSSIVSRDTAVEPAPALLDPPLEAAGG
jgi:hypothetical protein